MALDRKMLWHRYSRRRFIQLALLSTGLASLPAACRRSEDAALAPDSPAVDLARSLQWRQAQGQTLRVLLNAHPWTDGVYPYLKEFEDLTGIHLELQVVPEPKYFQAMEAALRSQPITTDVVFLPLDSTAYRLWNDSLLQPLTPYIRNPQLTDASYNLFDFPEGFRLAAKYPPEAIDQQLYGIPATFEAYILFYNKQLVNQHLNGQVPKTMADLVDAANRINQTGQEDVFGAVMRGVAADTIIDTVTGIVLDSWGSEAAPLPHNIWFDGDWQRPRFTDPRIVEGLAVYAQLMQAGPPTIKTMDWQDASRLFAAGKAAFYIDASLFGPGYESADSDIADDVGYSVLPRFRADSLTGHWLWGLGIARQSKVTTAAWLFVQWATSPQMEAQIAVKTGGAPRFSSWLTPSAYTQALNTDYALTVQTAMQTSRPTAVFHPQWNEVAIAIAQTIHTIYDGTSATIAAEQLQQTVMQLMAATQETE